ncbi:putative ABC transport system ATP-binding protein [Oceanisphaera litoralis]|uniref:ABC transporter ATP-binding protein n=1 Tax=Oceanisphaera litoralis TaxID=225144 RepID=UPI00195E1E44|nr:ABC transporter ATP-binding protein [Oceanisphaera litoralis]MBM7456448.1 putative ABC transport system ATP-binding protein [Oceanisphaera litoralis]
MTTSPIIKVAGLTHRVLLGDESLTILEGIGLEVKPGQSVALVGASGSGKSTLLGLLAGLDSATEGEIEISGQSLSALDEEQRARLRGHHIGFVFQSFLLLPTLTALENVMLPAELQGRDDGEQRARELLEQVGLNARLRHFPGQLSGGEQQRVAIARAFMTRPDILLADEPTGNLDHHTGAQIIELLFELNRKHGTTLLMVTHDEALASRCERRLLMTAGRLEEQHA